MKRFTLVGLLMILLWGVNSVNAEVSPYVMNFNKSISTSGDWVVGTGWNRSKDTNGNAAPPYTYYSWYGVDGTGTLYVGDQGEGMDMLVTPAVKGPVKLKIAQYNGNDTSWVEFYTLTYFMGRYIQGDRLNPDNNYSAELKSAFNNSARYSFIEVDIPCPEDEYTLIGIRGNRICLDDFSAASADIELVKSLKMNSSSISTTNFDINKDGLIPVVLYMSVQNTGDLDITKGEDNFTFSIYDMADGSEKLIHTKPFTQNIASGASMSQYDTIYIQPKNMDEMTLKLKTKENFSNTEYVIPDKTFKPVPNTPILSLLFSSQAVKEGADYNYPPTYYALYISNFSIRNDGGDTLKITKLSVPEGFNITNPYQLNYPIKVNPHMTQYISIQLPNTTPGKFSGKFEIESNAGNTYVNIKATMLAQDDFFIEGNMVPYNMLADATWSALSISSLNLLNNTMALKAAGDKPSKLISPLLEISEGDNLSFMAARRDDNPNLKVYTSTDRRNWTLIKEISPADLSNELVSTDYSGNKLYPFTDYEVKLTPGRQYIAFESSSIMLDNVLAGKTVAIEGADVALKSIDYDASATVNTPWEVRTTLYNTTTVPVAANSYTAELYVNGKKVSEAQAVEISGQKDISYGFHYTPNAVGELSAYVKFTGEGWEITSDNLSIPVEAESNNRITQIGKHTVASNVAPFGLSSTVAEAEMIYTPEVLKLKAGTKINRIRFKGAFNTWATQFNDSIQIWLENTSDNEFTEPLQRCDLSKMTRVVNTFVNGIKKGQVNTSVSPVVISESVVIFDFELSQPFEYTGENLRVATRNKVDGSSGDVYFEADGTVSNMAMARSGWGEPITNNFNMTPLPVIYFGIDSEPSVITGKITDKESGKALKDVEVKAVDENGVTYQGVSDASGRYEVTIYQDMHPYVLNVTLPGYMPVKHTIAADGNSTEDFQLEVAKGLFIDEVILPATAVRNYEMKVMAKVINPMSTKQAADYKVALMVDGEEVAAATPVEVAPDAEYTFNFTFTPHAVGEQEIYVVISHANNFVSESESLFFKVDDESYGGRVQVTDYSGSPFQTQKNAVSMDGAFSIPVIFLSKASFFMDNCKRQI